MEKPEKRKEGKKERRKDGMKEDLCRTWPPRTLETQNFALLLAPRMHGRDVLIRPMWQKDTQVFSRLAPEGSVHRTDLEVLVPYVSTCCHLVVFIVVKSKVSTVRLVHLPGATSSSHGCGSRIHPPDWDENCDPIKANYGSDMDNLDQFCTFARFGSCYMAMCQNPSKSCSDQKQLVN